MADIQSRSGLKTYRSGQRKKRIRKSVPGTCGQAATGKDDKEGEKQDLIFAKERNSNSPKVDEDKPKGGKINTQWFCPWKLLHRRMRLR